MEQISAEEFLLFENNSLFHFDKYGMQILSENIDGYLFDNIKKMFFLKKNGSVIALNCAHETNVTVILLFCAITLTILIGLGFKFHSIIRSSLTQSSIRGPTSIINN